LFGLFGRVAQLGRASFQGGIPNFRSGKGPDLVVFRSVREIPVRRYRTIANSMNAFLNIVRRAHEWNWCTRPYCTTCGSMEYRESLRELGTIDGGRFESVAELDLVELQALPGWFDALHLALLEIGQTGPLDRVLKPWLPQLGTNPRVADLVLFYFVRRGALFAPMSIELLGEWISACVEIAIDCEDASLIESLLYTCASQFSAHPMLLAVAGAVAQRSTKVRLAYERNKSRIGVLPAPSDSA
jgi:hypothetical protein